LIKKGAQRAASLHATQADAIEAAKKLLEKRPGSGLNTEEKQSAVVKESMATYPVDSSSGEAVSEFARLFGERLKRARIMRGYSLRSLQEALQGEISHTQLQKLEKGLVTADTRFLAKVSRLFKVRPDFFMMPERFRFAEVEYRSLTKVGKKARERLQEEAFEFFERFLEIESILEVKREALPAYFLEGLEGEALGKKVERAAEALRDEWKLGRNPIPNVHSMLEQNGVMVKLFRNAPQGFDGLATITHVGERMVPSMALAYNEDLPRFRLTALHELAHLVLRLPETLEHKKKEKLCHRFASAFLVPEEPFKKAFGGERNKVPVRELEMIKAEWGISCKAIITRARTLELVTQGYAKNFYIRYNAFNGDPGKWIGSEESRQFDLLVNQALSKGMISVSKAAGLLGEPGDHLMSSMDWQGE
jgi:Zn-dependent peptidase ImmA (M78 family)